MSTNKIRIRKLHAMIAPIMTLPLLLTLTTGVLYQMATASGRGGDFIWLINLHKGNLLILNLSTIYPYLNALGLLTLVITGLSMWWQSKRRKHRA